MHPQTVFLGIGSNIGNRLLHLEEAVRRLADIPDIDVIAVSRIYMTEPVGITEQDRFYNGVVKLATSILPEDLRKQCKTIEQEIGRPENYLRWSPRVIDLDILLYGDLCCNTETLTIPHPELHRRKFVMVPLLDIDDPQHPVLRCPISGLLKSCEDRSVLIRTINTIPTPLPRHPHGLRDPSLRSG
ncbi:2-amino-4-hydroxy-6-hydroxymethyldihydropteridine diphosphokinase [Chlorobium phaeobacteroides]|uniref:2-amino-4-hydroxy-6-hydroxymethyldihydropteridine pyrophosphokinase n=1 Tax=Chlorobium phaeobacteroides (strain DSM 266 / SMG 266 / 2430) TaxID=290317 RepID=A1BIR0_CHLPD|nr:2-amino-4-hydroxy-6-hydroxymethyldihydropteridine diphosphokinase [Chlorobium phaeobacteroides]ABL66287.1 2-amino-4-hydroxy-6-hydroxymethyldihydropteridine pyrophosphokinase [Chlorobium phaeobacteroides DSM 266]